MMRYISVLNYNNRDGFQKRKIKPKDWIIIYHTIN